jgi:hypothetical protein
LHYFVWTAPCWANKAKRWRALAQLPGGACLGIIKWMHCVRRFLSKLMEKGICQPVGSLPGLDATNLLRVRCLQPCKFVITGLKRKPIRIISISFDFIVQAAPQINRNSVWNSAVLTCQHRFWNSPTPTPTVPGVWSL